MSDAFQYVDFYHKPAEGERRSSWQRGSLEDAYAMAASWGMLDCYATVQKFANPKVPDTADAAEEHWGPLFVDFDSEDLAASQRDMLKLVRWAREDLDLSEDNIRVWFSGKKGFHVLLNPYAFGVVGDPKLTYVYKKMFGHVAAYLGLDTLDMSVYSKRRMWRLENSKHGATGLYKIRLDHDEITLDEPDILELASTGRSLMEPWTPGYSETCGVWLTRFWDELAAAETASAYKPVLLQIGAAPGDPVCVQDIEGNGLKKPGDRNKATVVLASYYKDAGRSKEEAKANLVDWALRLPADQRRMDNAYVRANTTSVVDSVYSDDGYKFGCSFIRSLHGPKTGRDYERVACMGEDCPFVKPLLATESIHEIHLSEIGNPEYIDKPVRTTLRVAGRTEQPFIVPRRVRLTATTEECDRPSCHLHAAGGTMIRDFSTDLRTLIAMCAVNDQGQKTIIRDVVTRSNCKSFQYEPLDYMRVTELACVPKAESAIGSKGELAVGKYTYQRAYALGDDSDYEVNSYFEVVGRVHAHPKTQHATLLITEATPLQDMIEDFDLEAARPLFEPYGDKDEETLVALTADLSVNVAKVAGRRMALLALLMTMHSPLQMQFDGERYGGWMQTLVVGDTGEAKSQLIERIMAYTGLGELVNAQNAGRTGLLYTIVNKDAMLNFIQWGAFVLNDRRLLVVDEGSGLEKREYAELRNARRDGVFKVSRSVTGEAQTRTRLIILSNPRYGRNMNEFHNGVEALIPLFEHADIRRFDCAIGFASGTVSHDQIEAELDEVVPHIFTPEVLRANILWAWSRKSDEVVWTPGTVLAVKAAAKRLNAKYEGSAVHLLSQDAKEKVARMSQALAATLHSSDPTHRTVVVKDTHVLMVEEMLDALYSASDLNFDAYVRRSRASSTTDYAKLGTDIHSALTKQMVDAEEVIKHFHEVSHPNNFTLESVCGDAKSARAVARELFKLRLIQTGRSGFDPTPMFNEYIKRWERGRAAVS